jgi:hypothetical protein
MRQPTQAYVEFWIQPSPHDHHQGQNGNLASKMWIPPSALTGAQTVKGLEDFSTLKTEQPVHLKRCYLSTKLHDVIFTRIFDILLCKLLVCKYVRRSQQLLYFFNKRLDRIEKKSCCDRRTHLHTSDHTTGCQICE